MWYIVLAVAFLAILIWQNWSNKKSRSVAPEQPATPEADEQQDKKHNYTNSYQPKWLFSYNEKDAFSKLQEVAERHELTVFAKVRLFDLIEPKKGCDNYKGALWKIQAKHVDFVQCDKKLIARYIIELDDSSHEAASRQERDEFVTAALENCGYKVLHVKAIDPE